MGTKNNPGDYDCHAKAEDDEPIFTLLARDPFAPYLVDIWTGLRDQDLAFVNATIQNAKVRSLTTKRETDMTKLSEALDCARKMREYYRAKNTH